MRRIIETAVIWNVLPGYAGADPLSFRAESIGSDVKGAAHDPRALCGHALEKLDDAEHYAQHGHLATAESAVDFAGAIAFALGLVSEQDLDAMKTTASQRCDPAFLLDLLPAQLGH